MTWKRTVMFSAMLVVCAVVYPGKKIAANDGAAINPTELSVTSEPKTSGTAAIYLYRQVDRDDQLNEETVYARVTNLTEEGRKNADVELPFRKTRNSVSRKITVSACAGYGNCFRMERHHRPGMAT